MITVVFGWFIRSVLWGDNFSIVESIKYGIFNSQRLRWTFALSGSPVFLFWPLVTYTTGAKPSAGLITHTYTQTHIRAPLQFYCGKYSLWPCFIMRDISELSYLAWNWLTCFIWYERHIYIYIYVFIYIYIYSYISFIQRHWDRKWWSLPHHLRLFSKSKILEG